MFKLDVYLFTCIEMVTLCIAIISVKQIGTEIMYYTSNLKYIIEPFRIKPPAQGGASCLRPVIPGVQEELGPEWSFTSCLKVHTEVFGYLKRNQPILPGSFRHFLFIFPYGI